jgi:segregation and condensation protein B
LEITEIKSVLEALLFASDKPVSLVQLAKVFDAVERKTVHQLLDELRADFERENRGYRLMEIAEGWQLVTRPEYASYIRKLTGSRAASRLTRPSLESLAIIAYKQPITKAEVEGIRGVNSDAVMHSLMERRLIRTVGRKDVLGRPLLYGTTRDFLVTFGLKDLGELPRLSELHDLLKQDTVNAELWEIDAQGQVVPREAEDFLKTPELDGQGEDDGAPRETPVETAGEGPGALPGEAHSEPPEEEPGESTGNAEGKESL